MIWVGAPGEPRAAIASRMLVQSSIIAATAVAVIGLDMLARWTMVSFVMFWAATPAAATRASPRVAFAHVSPSLRIRKT